MPEIRMHEKPACDFCGSEDPRWLFRAKNYAMDDIWPEVTAMLGKHENLGGWLACHQCVVYVQRADWNGLLRRVTANGGINPTIQMALGLEGLEEEMQAGLKRIWKQFAAYRVGGAIEWPLRKETK